MKATSSSLCFFSLLFLGAWVCMAGTEGTQVITTPISAFSNGIINRTEGCKHGYFCSSLCDSCGDLPRMICYFKKAHETCEMDFSLALNSMDHKQLCTWENIESLYYSYSACNENVADCLMIPWPNQLTEEAFVSIHGRYFKGCPTENLREPPTSVLLALVMTPICIIPLMVVLVVIKTKNGDGEFFQAGRKTL